MTLLVFQLAGVLVVTILLAFQFRLLGLFYRSLIRTILWCFNLDFFIGVSAETILLDFQLRLLDFQLRLS